MERITNKHRVLLVDDDSRILNFTRLKLSASGFEVVKTMTGQSALAMIESQKPDIMILDLKMPGMGGLEVLKLLRSFSILPVVVMSAALDLAEEAIILGANAFLPKPFNPDELIYKIRDVLDRQADVTLPQSNDLTPSNETR